MSGVPDSNTAQRANGLYWVSGELGRSLERVRRQVERFVDEPGDVTPLQRCALELHQIRGIASVAQCPGVFWLADEMKRAVQTMARGESDDIEAMATGLLAASVQLGDYIDLLVAGQPDVLLAFHPTINELRVMRGASVLSEAALFARHLLSVTPPDSADGSGHDALAQAVKPLLPPLQQALVAWARGKSRSDSLKRIGKIAQHLEQRAASGACRLLLASMTAAVESLLTLKLNESLEVKRLMGQACQQLKLVAGAGESGVDRKAVRLVAWQLAFHVCASPADGRRARALRDALGTHRLLCTPQALEHLRSRLRGPTTVVLNRVIEEVRDELGKVKDDIDVIVRTGDRDPARLDNTLAMLKRASDTLRMLGLEPLARVTAQQAEGLSALDVSDSFDPGWMDVASAVLLVETALEEALFGRVADPDQAMDGSEILASEYPMLRDRRDSTLAALRESLVNVSQLKELVGQYIQDGEPGLPKAAAEMLRQVHSVLGVLQADRASAQVERLRSFMVGEAFGQLRRDDELANMFAEGVACVECFLEGMQQNLPYTEHYLDTLEGLLDGLESVPVTATETAGQPAAEPEDAPAAEPELDEVDPEIRETFVEEAAEVLAELETELPRLAHDHADRDALKTIRRGFHTLKGSGRMVGADALAELAWSYEQLLNVCLDGARGVDSAVVEAISEVLDQLPHIMLAFQNGDTPPDSAALIDRARRLTRGEAGSVASKADPEVYRVFREDSVARLDAVEAELEPRDDGRPAVAGEPLVRALHTLRGSAAAVSQVEFAELAGRLERLAEALRVGEMPLEGAHQSIFRDSAAAMRAVLDGASADLPGLILQTDALIADLPAEVTTAGQQRSLTIVVTDEAADLLAGAEEAMAAWRAQPQQTSHAEEALRAFQSLRTSAQLGGFDEVVEAVDGLSEQVQPLTEPGSGAPGSAWFDSVDSAVERVYQMLDARRDGRALTEAPEPPAVEAPSAPEAQAPTQPPPEAADDVDDAQDAPTAVAETSALGDHLADADRALADWEAEPEREDALGALESSLSAAADETFDSGIADIARRLAQVCQQIRAGRLDNTRELQAQAHGVLDTLHALADAEAAGEPVQAGDTVAELDALLEAGAAADEVQPADTAPVQPPEPPAEQADEAAEAPQPIAEAPTGGAADLADSFDPDVAEIFLDEAVELHEAYTETAEALHTEAGRTASAPELRRILHTLKGGARMAGMLALGDLTHDLETRLDDVADGEPISDALRDDLLAAGDQIAAHIDDARRMGAAVAAPAEAAGYERDDVSPGDDDTSDDEQAAPAAPAEHGQAGEAAAQWDPQLLWRPEDDRDRQAIRRETARVTVEQLDGMLNRAGEVGIYYSRLEQQRVNLAAQLAEMRITIERLRGQIRAVDLETEAQIQARQPDLDAAARGDEDFDPLEMDRYTRMQELSRALSESAADLDNLHASMDGLNAETDALLQQQGQVNTALQQGLMSTLMVPFSRQVQRLQRVVRQVADEQGKQAQVRFAGIEAEMDRNVLERMTAPLEHMLRNAVVHGLETPEARQQAGKDATGRIDILLHREGTQLIVEVADDGRGLDLLRIREIAVDQGLLDAGAELSDEAIARLIFQPGFSTAQEVTQVAGRGVGMDVVAEEVSQLGGTVDVRSDWGRGVRFVIRLPLSLAISQALLVSAGHETYAIPIGSVEGVSRVPTQGLVERLTGDDAVFEYSGQSYELRYFGRTVGLPMLEETDERTHMPVVLASYAEGLSGEQRRVALVVDFLHGSREIVSKPVGPQVAAVDGIAGATIMPDGSVVLILDLPALLQQQRQPVAEATVDDTPAAPEAVSTRTIMVVDDSITMRRVAERVLTRNGYSVVTARDGLEAMGALQTEQPDAILLDIEMPKADGFEVATFVRNNDRLAQTPIVMITSRSGDKHRERAARIGVNRYMIKPYQEAELLAELAAVLASPHEVLPVDEEGPE